ncbi:hypothetical protein BB559_000290 [Furculomyces boomerangus]|uniref:Major facilitator superfamily (MFS) profile domain-containing protein n=1 Tax=Furculomyces boomerangus TaxID=61424 RepID=A0A2T9Z5R7_9FUNG|nr:hypothetical protein BB559_000290 [Furculomyces boomerangus]
MSPVSDNNSSVSIHPSIEKSTPIQDNSSDGLDSTYSWIVAVTATLGYLMIFGNFNAFGIFQEYYINTMFPNVAVGTVSWIGTITFTISLAGGVFASGILSIIGIRYTALLGCLLSSLGLLLASFSNTIWQLVITQGLIYGFGSSLIINCCLLMPSLWFQKHKTLAIAMISSGSGYGGVVIGPIITKAIKQYGVHWSFRILFFMNIVIIGLVAAVFKPRTEFKPLRTVVRLSLLKKPLTLFICFGGFFCQWGYTIPSLYFPASYRAIGGTRTASSNTIIAFSIASGTSRISSAFLSRKFGANTTLIFAMFISAILIFSIWLTTKNLTVYYVFYTLYGLACPLLFPLSPVIIANNYPTEEISQVNGLLYLFYGLSTLVGTPIAGVIFDNLGSRENYKPVIVFAGILYMISCLILVAQLIYCKKYIPKFKTGPI